MDRQLPRRGTEDVAGAQLAHDRSLRAGRRRPDAVQLSGQGARARVQDT